MSVSLNPITQQKLDQFERRRRHLVLTRGICAGLFSFLLLMTLIATADWLWVLPGSARWTMSLAGYAGTGLVVWLTCLRLLVRIPSREELAQFVEMTEPRLREQLLSAIELCADDPSRVYDSPVFRQLLQDRVGRQMETVNISSLLPLTILARWMAASVGIVAVFFLLLALPGFPFRLLMTRAILPGANLDRVSRIQVAILQPTPHSLTLPRDETVGVIVEISGGNVDEVTLETRTPAGEVLRQPMRVHGPMQFAANIAVEEESIDYRILAGDAVTRRYTIRSRMRPHVVAYRKTYRPPGYARLPDTTITESHGDLIALEGTQAQVEFQLDQPVAEAELRLEQTGSEELKVVALSSAGPLRYRAELPILKPGIYKVHLVAKQTGFDNPFSPKCEIRPEPDLIPRVGFVDADETTLLLPPNDILGLEGLAEDDLPLVALEQRISVNGRAWQSVPLTIDEKSRVTVDWQWDMLDLNLKSGDQVTTKLVATDRKGNEGESIPLQIVIASPDFDPDRHTVMQLKGDLYDQLADLAETVGEHAEAAKAIVARLRENPSVSEIPEGDRSVLLDLTHKVRDETDRVATRTMEILPKMPTGVDADELELVARLLARIRSDHMRLPTTYIDLPRASNEATATNEDLKQVGDAFQRSADDSQQLQQRFRGLLAHNILAAVARDLNAVREYQARVLDSGTQLSWQRLLRQETVVANQLRVVEQLIRKNSARLDPNLQRSIPRYIDWVSDRRTRLESAMESEDQLSRLRETASQLANELGGQQQIATLDGNLPRVLLDARRELGQRSGSLDEPIRHLAESTTHIKADTIRLVETVDSVETQSLQTSIERAGRQVERLQGNGSDRLTARRDAVQARIDADTQYASDAGLTRRALGGLLHRFAEEPIDASEIPEILAKIAPAYSILEAGHQAVQLDMALAHLLSLERWDSQADSARLDHPRQWEAIQDGCEQVAKTLRAAKYPDEIVGRIDRQRWSQPAQQAQQKITVRRWRYDDHVSAAHELAEMKTEFEAALNEIKPIMDEARALIAQHVPTLPEMARQAAQELRQLEEQTDATAESLADSQPQTAKEEVEQVQQHQQEVNRQLEDLLDALAEDANQQDLLTDEGRERARDADDSTRMIEEPAAQMNQAMDQATAAQESAQQARELSSAADQQERTADALDKIAEHYDRLRKGDDIAETRDALRQAERDMGIARQMDQQYADATQLAEMAAKTPQELMAELEAELAQNPAMQEALSEISQDALTQAKNSLENSAEREAEMERSVERSDQDFREQKQALAEELREIGAAARALADRQANQAESAAAQGKAPEARQQFNAARNQLYQEVAKAQNANQDAALDDLLEMARQAAEQAAEVADKLKQGEQATEKAKNEAIHENENRRAEQQRRFEADQKRFQEQLIRESKDRVKERSRQEQQAEKQVEGEQRDLEKAQQEVNRQRDSLNRDPNNESAQRSLREAEQRRLQAQRELEQAQRAQQRARQRREQADSAAQDLEKEELKPLTAPNPAAELANRQAHEAAELAEQMANRARQLAEQPEWADSLVPESGTLDNARQQQAEIGVDVDQAAEEVARAGRHEQRLDKADLARQLAEKAQDIEAVAAGEVSWSEQQLEEAAQEARPETQPRQGNREALEAHASIDAAEQAISELAEALETTLTPPEGSPQTADAGQPEGDPSSPEQQGPSAPQATPQQAARARMLARTLDELDQAMAGSPSTPSEPASSQPAPPTLAQAAQAQAAQMAQARMQARMAAQTPGREGAEESEEGAALVDRGGADAILQPVARTGDDWGQLRSKSAEDTVGSGRDAVSAEYRNQVETYFRVIAERARKKK